MSTLFAATHPARTAALILMGTFPREMQAPDYPWGVSEENLRRRLALLEEDDWAAEATRDWLGRVAPDILRDPAALRWYTSYVRRGASPSATKALRLMNAEIDIRDLLPTISVPTLVLHRAQESWRDGSRFMGEHIPGARVVELPGNDHLPWEGDRERAARRDRALPDGCSGGGASPTACSRHFCSPTSSDPLRRRRNSATAPGKTCSPSTIASCARSSLAFAATRSTWSATASSRRSTAPRARSGAPRRSRMGSGAGTRRTGRRAHGRGRAGGWRRPRHRGPHRRAHRRGGAARRGARLEHGQGHRRRLGHRLRGARRAASCQARRADGTCSQPTAERSPVDSMPSAPIASMHGVGLDASTGKPPLRPPAATNEGSRPTAIRERGLVRL